MDARRRSAAKVGTLASFATKQTLQLTQPDPFSPLSRDRSAFVQMKTRALAEVFDPSRNVTGQGTKVLRSRHVRLDQCFLKDLQGGCPVTTTLPLAQGEGPEPGRLTKT